MHKTHTPFSVAVCKKQPFSGNFVKNAAQEQAAPLCCGRHFQHVVFALHSAVRHAKKKKTNTPPRLRWNLRQVAIRAKPCLERLFPPARCSRPELFCSVIARDVSPRRSAELFEDIASVISFWFLPGGLRRSAQVLLALFFNGAIMYSETHFG